MRRWFSKMNSPIVCHSVGYMGQWQLKLYFTYSLTITVVFIFAKPIFCIIDTSVILSWTSCCYVALLIRYLHLKHLGAYLIKWPAHASLKKGENPPQRGANYGHEAEAWCECPRWEWRMHKLWLEMRSLEIGGRWGSFRRIGRASGLKVQYWINETK